MTEAAAFRFELRHDQRDPLLPWQWWAVFANGEEIYRAGFSSEKAARDFEPYL